MDIDTAKIPLKVVLDTNILISALLFGGKPRQILKLVLDRQIKAVTSLVLLAELSDVLIKKFDFSLEKTSLFEHKIKKYFEIVYPTQAINILKDTPDNRVLEAAIAGECQIIVTGDKELLELKEYKEIIISTADQFLNIYGI
ncbi:putative toxin-antitoxin system toxin component, PIN family [Candidatus Shapirobacteria bacterium CG08_land_8_20_14_0_20_39_18]|uniref:Putative toxin-antitoxin system toxin component, PIN family n=1 Tax=Candidatus Shapirobacteria bacterium CG08_land_8_20_14_0_20_39_18 TaxID=1974883 RepID=A0A2M6XC39_9BACT|nr:MAG: putative toxin-antitoxin system toxin component, PIN family [Candidatus Shapirobacteria bacterium CG08_land_8_20_14_0_20_39_18]PIY66387.1 MAG: putative toxin-antitoxin system toxin component, PIN family [Candidatus Shapirobacteria bacterium CG_4_10_14_0_8_um_filter_39_15]PJE68313.1 MAG: putative toxin-antitoxin system toxin component, PIN family [Candidatus Shapirobacteria bacterium CG10_big_fil_rev_8_21_14_0_10_38_8]